MIERVLLLIFCGFIYIAQGKPGVVGAMAALVLFQICHKLRYGFWFE